LLDDTRLTDGYHGELSVPTIAPPAIAAIAAGHGPQTPLDHHAVEPPAFEPR
jgi:hypothetical protein